MTSKYKDRPLIIASPPMIFFACLIAGGILHVLFRATLGGFPEAIRTGSGIILLSIAGVIAASAFMVLHRHRTPFNPYKATTRIVQKGAFRFTRNPMYLSLVLLMSAIALLVNAFSFVIMTILFVVIISRGVIQPEETYLEKKFGAEYNSYRERVRRWL
jgi:protein-S-isoprenylcysteine O-methyltransferase Ste14